MNGDADFERPRETSRQARGLQTVMTARLAVRQFLLLFPLAFFLFCMLFFFNLYNADFSYLWGNMPYISWRFVSIHSLIALVLAYVLLNGILFALGPSERGFNAFFFTMIGALALVNFDHSLLNWFFSLFELRIRVPNAFMAPKVFLAVGFFLVLVTMHYNVLSDDFARRMIRRGIPTEEVAKIRPAMFKVAVPTILTAGAIASGLALLAQMGAFIFGGSTLLIPKFQLVLLALLVVPIAFILRNILRELARRREGTAPPGPNG